MARWTSTFMVMHWTFVAGAGGGGAVPAGGRAGGGSQGQDTRREATCPFVRSIRLLLLSGLHSIALFSVQSLNK